MTNAVNLASAAGTGFAFRNRIINGAMEINQRAAAVTSTNYTVDRWAYSASQTSKATVQQNAGSITPPVGFSSYLGVTSSSAYSVTGNDSFQIYQVIEGFNCVDFGWGTSSPKTATLSFWVYSSLTGTFGGSIATNKTTVWVMPFTYSIPVANTWTYVTVLVPAPVSAAPNLDSQPGIFIRFGLGSAGTSSGGTAGTWTSAGNYVQPAGTVSVVGTNGATFYLTGVQLEVGSAATPFERRLYGQELALCQRYYQQYTQPPLRGVISASTAMARAAMTLPVTMRVAPTATAGAFPVYDGGLTGTVTGVTASYTTVSVAEFDLSLTNAPFTPGRAGVVYQNGSSTLTLSAEL